MGNGDEYENMPLREHDSSIEDGDDYELGKPGIALDHPRRSYWDRWVWVLHALLLSTSITFAYSSIRGSSCSKTCKDDGYRNIYSPLWDIVQVKPHRFQADVWSHSVFKGQPRPELDEAWSSVADSSLIYVDKDEMIMMGQDPDTSASNGEGKYFAMVEVFHQLHCLDLIRKNNFRSNYTDYISFSNGEAETIEHVDHCIDLIRQVIMCYGDVSLLTFEDMGTKQPPKARVSSVHMCRDWTAIKEWTVAHAFDRNKTDV